MVVNQVALKANQAVIIIIVEGGLATVVIVEVGLATVVIVEADLVVVGIADADLVVSLVKVGIQSTLGVILVVSLVIMDIRVA